MYIYIYYVCITVRFESLKIMYLPCKKEKKRKKKMEWKHINAIRKIVRVACYAQESSLLALQRDFILFLLGSLNFFRLLYNL